MNVYRINCRILMIKWIENSFFSSYLLNHSSICVQYPSQVTMVVVHFGRSYIHMCNPKLKTSESYYKEMTCCKRVANRQRKLKKISNTDAVMSWSLSVFLEFCLQLRLIISKRKRKKPFHQNRTLICLIHWCWIVHSFVD